MNKTFATLLVTALAAATTVAGTAPDNGDRGIFRKLPVATADSTAAILTETFSYPDGALVGAAGSPWVHVSGTTTGEINVVSGEAFLSDADTEDASSAFSSNVTGGIVSATFNFRNDTDVPTSTNGDYIISLMVTSPSTTQIARMFVQLSSGGPTDDFLIGVSTTSATPTATFANPFTAGTNLSITLSYDFTTDLASLAIAGFGTINATDAVDTAGIDRFLLREGAGSQGDAFIDNLSVDVVPEPATWMLMGVGLLLGAQRLRRKG